MSHGERKLGDGANGFHLAYSMMTLNGEKEMRSMTIYKTTHPVVFLVEKIIQNQFFSSLQNPH